MAEPLVAGIDLSTQSCTVEIRKASDLSIVSRARTPLPPTHPPVSEQDALDWWRALKASFLELRSSVDLRSVEAVSASGQCHGLVALDSSGAPIRPVKLWNDTSTSPYLEGLFERIPRETWVERTGSVPTGAFTISKLAWYLSEEPENAAKTWKILLPHDYLNYRLTGICTTDRSEASGTGYFDSVTNSYDYGFLRECFGDAMPWEEMFPQVLGPDDSSGVVTEEAAEDLGILPGIPVAAGGGDQHIAALGLGLGPGDVIFSLGTSGVVIASSATPVQDRTGRVNGVANASGGWLPLVCTLNSTKVTDWLAQMMGVSIRELDSLALQTKASEPVPAFAAYLDGERSPSYPSSTGVLTGLVGTTSRSALARSAFEGVLGGLIRGMEAIEECGVELDGRVIVIGGGSRSAAYTKILAELLGRPVEVVSEPEATARGACLQAKLLVDGIPVEAGAKRFRPLAESIVEPSPSGRSWMNVRREYLRSCDFAGGLERESFLL